MRLVALSKGLSHAAYGSATGLVLALTVAGLVRTGTGGWAETRGALRRERRERASRLTDARLRTAGPLRDTLGELLKLLAPMLSSPTAWRAEYSDREEAVVLSLAFHISCLFYWMHEFAEATKCEQVGVSDTWQFTIEAGLGAIREAFKTKHDDLAAYSPSDRFATCVLHALSEARSRRAQGSAFSECAAAGAGGDVSSEEGLFLQRWQRIELARATLAMPSRGVTQPLGTPLKWPRRIDSASLYSGRTHGFSDWPVQRFPLRVHRAEQRAIGEVMEALVARPDGTGRQPRLIDFAERMYGAGMASTSATAMANEAGEAAGNAVLRPSPADAVDAHASLWALYISPLELEVRRVVRLQLSDQRALTRAQQRELAAARLRLRRVLEKMRSLFEKLGHTAGSRWWRRHGRRLVRAHKAEERKAAADAKLEARETLFAKAKRKAATLMADKKDAKRAAIARRARESWIRAKDKALLLARGELVLPPPPVWGAALRLCVGFVAVVLALSRATAYHTTGDVEASERALRGQGGNGSAHSEGAPGAPTGNTLAQQALLGTTHITTRFEELARCMTAAVRGRGSSGRDTNAERAVAAHEAADIPESTISTNATRSTVDSPETTIAATPDASTQTGGTVVWPTSPSLKTMEMAAAEQHSTRRSVGDPSNHVH